MSRNQTTNINNQRSSETRNKALSNRCPRNQTVRSFVQEIQIPGSDPFKVICYSDDEVGSGWMMVYKKSSESKEFNRTYEEYEMGFGYVGTKLQDGFFIGLERLHLLVNGKPHSFIFNNFKDRQEGDNFQIGNRREGYMVKSVTERVFTSGLRLSLGMKFSTFDRDEDGDPNHNWAKERGLGWWFDRTVIPNNGLVMLIKRED